MAIFFLGLRGTINPVAEPEEEEDNNDGAAGGTVSPAVAGRENNEDDLDNLADRALWDQRTGLRARCAPVEIV